MNDAILTEAARLARGYALAAAQEIRTDVPVLRQAAAGKVIAGFELAVMIERLKGRQT